MHARWEHCVLQCKAIYQGIGSPGGWAHRGSTLGDKKSKARWMLSSSLLYLQSTGNTRPRMQWSSPSSNNSAGNCYPLNTTHTCLSQALIRLKANPSDTRSQMARFRSRSINWSTGRSIAIPGDWLSCSHCHRGLSCSTILKTYSSSVPFPSSTGHRFHTTQTNCQQHCQCFPLRPSKGWYRRAAYCNCFQPFPLCWLPWRYPKSKRRDLRNCTLPRFNKLQFPIPKGNSKGRPLGMNNWSGTSRCMGAGILRSSQARISSSLNWIKTKRRFSPILTSNGPI